MSKVDLSERFCNQRLTQIGQSFRTTQNRHAVFECSCGKRVILDTWHVRSNKTKSCGCWNNESLLKRSVTHGNASAGRHTPTYKTWRAMLSRCRAKTGTHHGKRYADRGIQVCHEWLSFERFLLDMGERPDGLTIERKDNSKGYSKDNCIWATKEVQSRNTSRTRIVSFNGYDMCLHDAAVQHGLSDYVLRYRLKSGWPVEKALTTPVRKFKDRS